MASNDNTTRGAPIDTRRFSDARLLLFCFCLITRRVDLSINNSDAILHCYSELLDEKNCGSEKNKQAKNGGAEGGGGCERESQEEAGEESVKVGWTRGQNGRGRLTERADALTVEGRRKP